MAQIDLGQVQATVTVGTTTTVGGSTGASVTNSGTTANAVLDFTIPSGCYSIVECGSTDTIKELMPQTMYVWGEVSSLTITLASQSPAAVIVLVTDADAPVPVPSFVQELFWEGL